VAVKSLPSAVITKLKKGDADVIAELIRFVKNAGVVITQEEGRKIVEEVRQNKRQLVVVFKELALAFATL
jgi:hypothetical protein